ncbi:MAG: MFS transporter [Alphaproteobacteria bacterium]
MSESTSPRGVFRGWYVVLGTFTVLFIAFGGAYSFPAFFESFQKEFGATRGEVSLVFSIAGLIYFVAGAVTGVIADRIDPRWVIAPGIVMIGAGLILGSFAEKLWHVYLAYGLGVGFGVGFAYVPSVGPVQRWFVKKRGTASGLAVTGIGAGTLITPIVAAWLIADFSWRTAYLALGIFSIIVGVLGTWLIEASPQKRGLAPDGDPAPTHAAGTPRPPLPGFTIRGAIRQRPFVQLYLAGGIMSLALFVPFVHLAPYAKDHGLSDGLAVLLIGLIGVGSTLGRFVMGGIADRFGRRQSLIGMFVGIALIMLYWLIATKFWELALFALVFGACYGGFVALVPAVTVDYFGPRNAGGIIGALYTSVGLSTFLGPAMAGYAFDFFGSYTWPIVVSAVAAIVGAIFIGLLTDPEAWKRTHPAH